MNYYSQLDIEEDPIINEDKLKRKIYLNGFLKSQIMLMNC